MFILKPIGGAINFYILQYALLFFPILSALEISLIITVGFFMAKRKKKVFIDFFIQLATVTCLFFAGKSTITQSISSTKVNLYKYIYEHRPLYNSLWSLFLFS